MSAIGVLWPRTSISEGRAQAAGLRVFGVAGSISTISWNWRLQFASIVVPLGSFRGCSPFPVVTRRMSTPIPPRMFPFQATAVAYFQRFYLSNSVLEHDPKILM